MFSTLVLAHVRMSVLINSFGPCSKMRLCCELTSFDQSWGLHYLLCGLIEPKNACMFIAFSGTWAGWISTSNLKHGLELQSPETSMTICILRRACKPVTARAAGLFKIIGSSLRGGVGRYCLNYGPNIRSTGARILRGGTGYLAQKPRYSRTIFESTTECLLIELVRSYNGGIERLHRETCEETRIFQKRVCRLYTLSAPVSLMNSFVDKSICVASQKQMREIKV